MPAFSTRGTLLGYHERVGLPPKKRRENILAWPELTGLQRHGVSWANEAPRIHQILSAMLSYCLACSFPCLRHGCKGKKMTRILNNQPTIWPCMATGKATRSHVSSLQGRGTRPIMGLPWPLIVKIMLLRSIGKGDGIRSSESNPLLLTAFGGDLKSPGFV